MTIAKYSCRICLKNVGFVSLFVDEGDGIAAEMISSLFNINLISDEYLPNNVCTMCLENIKSAFHIKETILNSEIVLSTYLEAKKSAVAEESNNLETIEDSLEGDSLEDEQLNFECTNDSSQDSLAKFAEFASNKDTKMYLRFPEMYECDKCNAKTDTYKELLNHKRTHPDAILYECEHCGRSFRLPSQHRKHAAIHRDARPFKCPECSKSFKVSSNFTAHILTHKKERLLPCPRCNKTFRYMKGLKTHLLIHNERTEVCKICNKSFKHAMFLRIHMARHTPNQHTSPTVKSLSYVICEFCGKRVNSTNLKKHIDVRHLLIPEKKECACAYCDKHFQTSSALTVHMQCHFNSRKVAMDAKTKEQLLQHKCDECNKAFTRPHLLKNHKLIHSGVKEHVCSYCEKRFTFKMHLNQHVRLLHEVGNPKNSVCEFCSKVCINAKARESHMLTHTGETPFKCKFCNSKFAYAKSLRLHVKNKHKTH